MTAMLFQIWVNLAVLYMYYICFWQWFKGIVDYFPKVLWRRLGFIDSSRHSSPTTGNPQPISHSKPPPSDYSGGKLPSHPAWNSE